LTPLANHLLASEPLNLLPIRNNRNNPQPPTKAHTMIGYYEIKGSKNGKFVFNLKAANHEVILSSQVYENRANTLIGIASVRHHGPKPECFEKKISHANEPFFVLKAANHEVIGKSEMYSSDAARDHGIASVIANSPSPEVREITE
jgi:uncharacterized protein YegP (UPF0339 family)